VSAEEYISNPILISKKCPHLVQQVMSNESTPVLSGAIPAFETFMMQWEHICENHEDTRHWVDVGLSWAETYYRRMDCTKAYVIAMRELVSSLHLHSTLKLYTTVINPCIRLSWIRKHWEHEYITDAEAKIRATVCQLTSPCT
jgi:hypothetical protein